MILNRCGEKAEIKVFAEFGVPLTEEMCKETMGLRVDEVVEYWSHRYPLSINDYSVIEDRIMDGVISLVESDGEILPGVTESLVFLITKE